MVVKIISVLLICTLSIPIHYKHMDLEYVTNEASRLTSFDRNMMLEEIGKAK